jgi:hypothetical protein
VSRTSSEQKPEQPDPVVEKQFNHHRAVFEQVTIANKVACLVLVWLEEKTVPYTFERIEPSLANGVDPVTPDLIAAHKRRNSGLVVEIKSERDNSALQYEGERTRKQLESYLGATNGWPATARGATRRVDSVDILFICHSHNVDTYFGEIQKSPKLKGALETNFTILAWEVVEVRGSEKIRIRHYKGTCSEKIAITSFMEYNGFERDIKDLTVIQENNLVRMKTNEVEPLLVLLTEKALSLPLHPLEMPSGLLPAERPAFVYNEQVFFHKDALLKYINSTDDADRQKYLARIDTRLFDNIFGLLLKLDVFTKDTASAYFIVTQAKGQKDISYWVLRLYAKHVLSLRPITKDTGGTDQEVKVAEKLDSSRSPTPPQ